jgi:hypothetical protein
MYTIITSNTLPIIASANFEETHNTLKFAQRAKKITNKAKYSSDTDKNLLIKYRQEIDELKVITRNVPPQLAAKTRSCQHQRAATQRPSRTISRREQRRYFQEGKLRKN